MINAVCFLEDKREESVENTKPESFLIYLPRSLAHFEKWGEILFFPKNHILLEAGKKTEYCYVVKNGRVVSYEIMPDGEERIYHFYEKNSLFLEESALFGKPSLVGYQMACGTEVIRIHKNAMINAIQKDPKLALELVEASSIKFQSSMEQVRHVRNYNIPWMVCDLLLSLADYCGLSIGNKVLIQEKISQQTISSILGVNRITTVRAIKELKKRGLIEQVRGRYVIQSKAALIAYQQSVDKYTV